MKITPQAEIALQHRAYHTATGAQGQFAAFSRLGRGTLIASDLSTRTIALSKELTNVTLSPDGSALAVAAADGITLYSTATLQRTGHLTDTFEACLYASDNLFWTCSYFSRDTRILEAWEPRQQRKIATERLQDPYGDSRFFLFRHPEPNSIAIWGGAGQDGQCAFWATLANGTIQITQVDSLVETGPPAIRADSAEFLVCSNGELKRYRYPNGPLLGTISQLPHDNHIDYLVSYVNNTHALLASGEERLFLIDLDQLHVVDELIIYGADAMVSRFERLADGRFFSIHRGPNPGLDTPDRLLLWDLPA